MPEKLKKAFNDQVTMELASANAYLQMSSYLSQENFEERPHADLFLEFILDRRGVVTISEVAAPKADFTSALNAFETALAQEEAVTAAIHDLYRMASELGDLSSFPFLQDFISEQNEEEAMGDHRRASPACGRRVRASVHARQRVGRPRRVTTEAKGSGLRMVDAGYPPELLFERLRSLRFTPGEYAVFGSGPMAARGLLDEVNDKGIVRGDTWQRVKDLGTIVSKEGDAIVDLGNGLTFGRSWAYGDVDIDKLIDEAEVIGGLAFVRLSAVTDFKRIAGRPKDREHPRILEAAGLA